MTLAVCSLLILLLFVCVLSMWIRDVRMMGTFATPLTVFVVLGFIDVVLPALLAPVIGIPEIPEWVRPLSLEDCCLGAVVFTFGLFLLGCGYTIGQLRSSPISSPAARLHPIRWGFLFITALTMWGWYNLTEVHKIGTLAEYLEYKVKWRWVASPLAFSSWREEVVYRLVSNSLPLVLAMALLGFCYRRWMLFGRFSAALALAWVCSLATFFRGTQIAFFLSVLCVWSWYRRDAHVGIGPDSEQQTKRGLMGELAIGAALILAFIAYGTIRDYRADIAWSGSGEVGGATERNLHELLSGHGLISISSIIKEYPKSSAYFEGKTFTDMVALVIPRSIWPAKPEWYGIDDITRRMGWAPSSQSAVTMPGELWANWGPFSLILMFFWGLLYGLLARMSGHFRWRFLYVSVFLPSALVAHWMSFTGFVNAMLPVPLVAMALLFVIRSDHRATTTEVRRD